MEYRLDFADGMYIEVSTEHTSAEELFNEMRARGCIVVDSTVYSFITLISVRDHYNEL